MSRYVLCIVMWHLSFKQDSESFEAKNFIFMTSNHGCSIPVSFRLFFVRFAYITARSSRQEFCTHFHLRERSRDVRDKIVTRYIYSFALFDAMFQFSVFTKGDGILSRVDGEQTKTRRDFGSNSAHSAQLLWRYMRISLRAQTRRASWTGLFECGE